MVVILSLGKDLSGCKTINRYTDLEILHFVQDDSRNAPKKRPHAPYPFAGYKNVTHDVVVVILSLGEGSIGLQDNQPLYRP